MAVMAEFQSYCPSKLNVQGLFSRSEVEHYLQAMTISLKKQGKCQSPGLYSFRHNTIINVSSLNHAAVRAASLRLNGCRALRATAIRKATIAVTMEMTNRVTCLLFRMKNIIPYFQRSEAAMCGRYCFQPREGLVCVRRSKYPHKQIGTSF